MRHVKTGTANGGIVVRILHAWRFAVRLRTSKAGAEVLNGGHVKMRLEAAGAAVSSFIQNQFEKNVVTTCVDHVFNWARKSAHLAADLRPGLLRHRDDRRPAPRASISPASAPRSSVPARGSRDLMIVAGTVTLKMAPVLKRIWDQMPDPKWCISMGACSSVGGPFNTYAVLQGVDKIVPVDVYVTGCPPRPENLFYALLKLQDKIDQMTTLVKRPTEVRLDESMLEEFKQQIRIAQIQNPV